MVSPDFNSGYLQKLEQQALQVMRELATAGLSFFQMALESQRKADGSLVSEADRKIELMAREKLAALTPDFGFVGEEFGPLSRLIEFVQTVKPEGESHNPRVGGLNHFEHQLDERPRPILNLDADTYWMLDPIDGTINFLSKVPLWSTLLALVHRGRPVLGLVALPALNEVFIASAGNGSRFGALFGTSATEDARSWQPCVVAGATRLADATISYSTPKTFAYRGIESFLSVLQQTSKECRTHSDAFGYTRVLRGGVDVMVDPLVAPYDVAALQVLFDETPGTVFTTLQGHSGESRFRKGSIIAGANTQLVNQFLNVYREHLVTTAELSQTQKSLLSEPLIPERFKPTFALDFETVATHVPAKIWARALETAIAKFSLRHPNVQVEDVSILLSTEESAMRAFSNGRSEGPPRFYAATTFHVRAILAGAAGLATGNPGFEFSPVELILAALDSAWAQYQQGSDELGSELLAAREQVIAHVGQHPWRSVHFTDDLQSVSGMIQKYHGLQTDKRIHSLKSRLNMSVEYRWQYFMDSSQQTFVTQVCRMASNATCSEKSEKRTAYLRYLRNHFPARETLAADLESHFKKVQQQSLDLLPAVLVPENPEYDYLAVDADLLGLILHEAVGHAAEGDLIQTGASGFGQNGEMLELEVGPQWLDILIDGTLDNCGYLPVDAEGVLPRRKMLVEGGRLVDAIHTRHTAKRARKSPDGCARTQSLQYPSLNRMTSIWVRPAKTKPIEGDLRGLQFDELPAELIQRSLEKNGYLDGTKGVLLLSGWKGGTASCSNLEFRADVARVIHLKKGTTPTLMREANFTGIATECFRSAVDAFGPTLCRSIGTCGKDGQGVLTSDGGPAFMVFKPNSKVRVIGTGENEEQES